MDLKASDSPPPWLPRTKPSELVVRYRDSLRVLSFQHILIESGSEWPTVLAQFRDQLPYLEELSVQWLAQYGLEGGSHVIFPDPSIDPIVPGSGGRRFSLLTKWWMGETRLFGADYQGPGVDKAWDMLIKALECI